MEFFNNRKLADFVDKDVHVVLTTSTNVCETLPLCHAFLRDGKLCIDIIPQLNKKYVVEVPEDSLLSRNDVELSMGRYAIVIKQDSEAGCVMMSMLEAKRKHAQDDKK